MRFALTRRSLFGLALALAALPTVPLASAHAEDVTVFAAASLKNALDDVAAAYKAETGKNVLISYAASNALAKQIEEAAPGRHLLLRRPRLDGLPRGAEPDPEGHPPDAPRQRDRAGRAGGFDRDGHPRTGRRPRRAPRRRRPSGHGQCRFRAGRQIRQGGAREARHLGERRRRIVQADNVRAALAFVATGEAPLGIVYQTDANSEPKVKVVATFPADSHPPILYPVAMTASSTNPDAERLLRLHALRQGQARLRETGLHRVAPAS